MIIVHLKDLIFQGQHGVYEGENEIGNTFQVDLMVKYENKKIKFDNIRNVINYEDLYQIVKKRMAVPMPLLEEVGASIIRKIRHEYNFGIKEVIITIFKLNAPIEGLNGKVGITLQKKFDE